MGWHAPSPGQRGKSCALLLLPRCVWIEKESINSVVISDSPADLHQRMLVAASLSVNETGNEMASVC